MKKLIALLAVAGMMFSSFAAYAGTLTEAEFIANHKQQITNIENSVKEIVTIYKTTEQGKKIIKCAKEDTTPRSLPDITQAEKEKLQQANQEFENQTIAFAESLSTEDKDFIKQLVTTQYGTKFMEAVESSSQDELEAFFAMFLVNYMQETLLANISADEWELFGYAEAAIIADELSEW